MFTENKQQNNQSQSFAIHTMYDDLHGTGKKDAPTSLGENTQSAPATQPSHLSSSSPFMGASQKPVAHETEKSTEQKTYPPVQQTIAPSPAATSTPQTDISTKSATPITQQVFPEKPSASTPAHSTAALNTASIHRHASPEKSKEDSIKKKLDVPAKKQDSTQTASLRWPAILTGTLVFISILGLGGGGYYYLMTKRSNEPALPTPQQPVEPEVPAVVAPTIEKYSTENPNYLSIDPEQTAESIKQYLATIAEDVAKEKEGIAYEFIITDKNNNPIAFPIFALKTELNLSSTFLVNVDEPFSFYLYKENGRVRSGIKILAKNKDLVKEELKREEPTLPSDLDLLFLTEKPSLQTGAFHDGSYRDVATRYLNLDENETLSVDYAFNENILFMGTSKNTLRAILDKNELKS